MAEEAKPEEQPATACTENVDGEAPQAEGGAPPEEKKKRGKPKDPYAPPKPKNPFSKFGSECRARLKEERPELVSDLSAMGKALAEEWQKVPEDEKTRLQAEYEKEMVIWKPKWAAYKQTKQYKDFVEVKTDWLDKRAQKKLVKTMNKDAPKRPKSGYMIYGGEIREEILEKVKAEGLGMGDVGRLISERWNALSEAKKASYGEQSQQQRIVFDEAFEKYKKTDAFRTFVNEKVKLETVQKLKKAQRVNLDGAPKRPPSGFGLYKNEVMPAIAKENEGKKEGEKFTCGDITKKIGEMWANLAEDKKAEYNKTSDAARVEWEKAFKDFKTDRKYRTFLESRKNLKERENKMVNLREMPKKPKSVFAMFAEEHKKEVEPGRGEGKGNNALKQKFADASMEEKRKYEEKRKELEESWTQEVAEYKSSVKYATFEKTQARIDQEFKNEAIKVTTLKFLSAAPPAPPKSAFAVFLGDKRKADADAGGETKDKKAKKDDVNKYKDEFLKLPKDVQAEYESKQKEKLKAYEEQVREFMKGEMWQEYQKEAKRMKIPIKSLMLHKKQVIKSLKDKDGKINISAIPLPEKPDSFPSKPKNAMKLFIDSKTGEGGETPAAIMELWKNLDAEAKKEWDAKASEDVKRYQDAVEVFNASNEGKKYLKEFVIATRRRKMVLAKDKYLKEMPQKPPVAFMEFIKKNKGKAKKENAELKGFELEKKMKEMWTGLPEDEKEALEKAAKDRMDEYEAKLEEFKKSDNWKKYTMMTKVKVGKFGKKQGKSKAKAKAKAKAGGPAPPSKPESYPAKPLSAFEAFAKEEKEAGRGVAIGEMQKRFTQLDEEEKKRRTTEANERREKFRLDMEAWEKSKDGRMYKMRTLSYQRQKKIKELKEKFMKDEPVKPKGAFFIFLNANRSKIASENPDCKGMGQVMAKCSEVWKNISESDKQIWLDKEKEAMEEYQQKLKEFQEGENYKRYKRGSESVMRIGKGKTKAKAKAKGFALPPPPEKLPKPAKNSMMLFADHCRSSGGPTSIREINVKWMQLGAEGQKPFKEQEESLKKKCEEDMIEFRKTLEGKKYFRLKAAAEKKQKLSVAKKKYLSGESAPVEPKRPASAFFMFLAEKGSSVKESDRSKRAKLLTEMWSASSPEEKKVFEDKAAAAKTKYEEDMKAFKSSKGFKEYEKTLNRLSGKNDKQKQAQLKKKEKEESKKAKAEEKKKALDARAAAKAARAPKRAAPAPKATAAPVKKSGSDSSNAMGSDSKSSSSSSSSSKSSGSD